MKANRNAPSIRIMLIALLLGVIALSNIDTTQVHAVQSEQRPLSDFIDAQGTTMSVELRRVGR